MVEFDKVYTSKIKQDGIFNFKEMYRFCLAWLVDENYDVTEKTYTEKITAVGKELEIRWDAVKKISDYFKFNIMAVWKILNMSDVEVTENGKKIKMNKGSAEIRITGVLQKDYENKWEDNPFSKFLRTLYDKHIIRARIEQYEGKIFAECDEFANQIKSFLVIEGKK